MYITAYFKMLVIIVPDMQSDQDHRSPGLRDFRDFCSDMF